MRTYSYSFDPIGNRLNSSLAGADWSYTTNNLNQYTQLVKGTGTWDPTNDDDGNMLTCMGWTQVWNCENRLIKTSRGDTRLTFAYDYMGRRVEKKVFTGEVLTRHLRFVYNEYKLVEELDALNNNATLRRYTWQPDDIGLDVPLSVFDLTENKTYFYHTDANKNVTELTDSEGTVVAHYEYSPFGMVTKLSGDYAATNPFRFSSEYHDSETGLIYYNYRYYDPQLGRWLSRDPIGEDGGWNLYGTVNNNSITYTDHLGEEVPAMDSVSANPSVALGLNAPMGQGFKGVAKQMFNEALRQLLDSLPFSKPCPTKRSKGNPYQKGERRKAGKPTGTPNPEKAENKQKDHQTGKRQNPKPPSTPEPREEPELVPKPKDKRNQRRNK